MSGAPKSDRHVLGLSGGRDSAALAVFMRQRYPHLNIEYFFTDTGKELPEVYEYLGRLEGLLDKTIMRLDPERDFDFWLKEYNHFLPSPQTRWCTRMLKLKPFERWIRPSLKEGQRVFSYVAIRSDEDHRDGMVAKHPNLEVILPFREHGIDKQGVIEILESSGVGLPSYYQWRSRSGCTFCFYQQKIEWVRLKKIHPDKFEEAKSYEKDAIAHGSPFTWSSRESLQELERPERMAQIEADFEVRKQRERLYRPINPLRPNSAYEMADVDSMYLDEEGGGACLVCHK